jgi:hypothetical protein
VAISLQRLHFQSVWILLSAGYAGVEVGFVVVVVIAVIAVVAAFIVVVIVVVAFVVVAVYC